jgi:hypothetical protein
MTPNAHPVPMAPDWRCGDAIRYRNLWTLACATSHLSRLVPALHDRSKSEGQDIGLGLRNIGIIRGESAACMLPTASNPCRSYKRTFSGLVASRGHQEPKSLRPAPFAGLYSNPRVRQASQSKFPDASEAVRIGSRYRKSAGICAVREK